MQVVIIKDGTVPIALAKVVETDGEDGANLARFLDREDPNSDINHLVEAFTVPDSSRFVFVGWSEGEGFNVIGCSNLDDALNILNEDATPNAIAESNLNGRHWAVTYGEESEYESYGHVFTLLS